MVFRFALTFALISLAVSIAIPVAQHEESPAEYEFSYSVNEHSTGDIKSHQESRKGNAVTGKYELIDSDGYRRIVEYTADEHTGFNAIVRREPTDIKIPIFESYHASHHVQEPAAHYYTHGAHLEQFDGAHHLQHTIPVQQPYVAPKVKTTVKPIEKVAPIVVAEPEQEEEQNVHQVKYVAPSVAKVSVKASAAEHSQLNTHVSYDAPQFNYHY